MSKNVKMPKISLIKVRKFITVIIISTREVRQVFDWIQPKLHQFDILTDILNPDEKFWNQHDVLGITNRKIPASIYIDDRGLRFTNWGDILKYFI